MGKKKPATRRGGSDTLVSPRAKPTTGQDEPVTDTVMQVIARRVRNARKKLQRVTVIEGLLEEGQTLNEDQERVYMTKVPLNAIIEELVKLEPLVEAALGNELSEHLNTAKEEWEKKREEEDEVEDEEVPSQVALVASEEGGESEATVEGPSTTAKEKEETTDVDVDETTRDDNDATNASRDVPTWNDENAEALYFLQLFASGRFDVRKWTGEDEASVKLLTSDETDLLETFGKKIFQTTSHVPSEALAFIKESTALLFSRAHPDALRVFEIVAKLRSSAFVEEELKLAVHGFPLAIEKEVSDTTTEHTDKSEEKLKQETPPHADPATEQPSSYTDENPPSSSPVHPATSSHYTHPQDTAPMGQRTARPFLPFPGVGMTTTPPLRFGVTPPPNMMGMHSFYSMARVPGHFVAAPPYSQTPPVHPALSHPPLPIVEQNAPMIEPDTDAAQPAVDMTHQPDPSTAADKEEEAAEDFVQETQAEAAHPAATSTPEMAREGIANTGREESTKPQGVAHPQRPAPPNGGRFSGGGPVDHRPVWQGRGRNFHSGHRGGMRGRGMRGGGRYPHPYGGGPRGRPPFDPQQQMPPQQSHAPFMQSAGGERHPYNPRPRQRRGGYDGSKDVGQRH